MIMSIWKLIASAPLDETQVLIWDIDLVTKNNPTGVVEGWYDESMKLWRYPVWDDFNDWWDNGYIKEPSHWTEKVPPGEFTTQMNRRKR